MAYNEFIYLMTQSTLCLTDSGGIQEEAPSCNLPVLILREATERQEVVDAKLAKLVGTNTETIFNSVKKALTENWQIPENINPYGSGDSAKKICSILQSNFI